MADETPIVFVSGDYKIVNPILALEYGDDGIEQHARIESLDLNLYAITFLSLALPPSYPTS
jgi:hypothetical protein